MQLKPALLMSVNRHMKIIQTALLFLLILCCPFLHAQQLPVKKLKFDAITISEGLSQGMINCMLQDRFGFMWFGTKDGLNRYDGYKFIIYRYDATDLTTIADNFIQTIFEDSKGRLWIGTANKGLDLFDRETETFMHFRHDENNPNTLCDDHILNIGEDKAGNIRVATIAGMSTIRITEKPGQSLLQAEFNFTATEKSHCNFIVTSSGEIWVSALNKGLYKIDPSKEKDKIIPLDVNEYCKFPHTDNGLETFVQGFTEDKKLNRLYLIMEFNITSVNLSDGSIDIHTRPRYNGGRFSLPYCMDRTGKLWLVENNWLEIYDPTEKSEIRVLAENSNLTQMLDNVNCTYIDRSGLIWIGTKGYGLLKYNPRSEVFHKTGGQSITWMESTSDGQILYATNNTVVNIFDPSEGKVILSIPDSNFKHQKDYESFGITSAVIRANDGMYWLSKGALTSFDINKNELKKYRQDKDPVVFPVFEDRKGNIWTGTEKAFLKLNKQQGTFTEYRYPFRTKSFPYEFLQAIYEDENGIFWLGTLTGMARFDPVKETWKLYRSKAGDSSSLSYDLIFCISPDPSYPNRYLWIGTNGGGLNRFDKETSTFTRFTEKDGLPNNVIYGIVADDASNLWLSTNNGLSRFTPLTRTFRNFQAKDGLQGNEFNRYAYCRTKDGTLFFGGVNGFNYFHPRNLSENTFIAPLVITDFRIRNQSVLFKDSSSLLEKPVFLTSEINLPYSDNMITFEFASLDFTASEKNVYEYMLEGFDKNWIHSGTTNSATYTNLDPGTYTFFVKGRGNDGVWNEAGASVKLRVFPPWYMSFWFRLLALLTISAAIYGIYKYRLNQALKLAGIRNRIAGDLHDEIGSNLSSISIFSEVAREKSLQNPDVIPLMNKISDYTQESMEAMNDIVWMINAGNDRFENIIIRMRTLSAELLEVKNIHLSMNVDERLNDIKPGMEDRKSFYLIYKEALNNIVKYADCRNVWIDLIYQSPGILMSIKDDGTGFNMHQYKKGNGLLNMKRRASTFKHGKLNIVSSPGHGTIVELYFEV